ncbi:MAG: ATP-binding protein, partial [Acidiferrobacterales bacterium]|nr:ATP-binding protein [Acidiferrobacterales bacterium]
QPLTAILSNAQAALRFLKSGAIDIDELRDILKDIIEEDQRAGEVIHRLHALFKQDESRPRQLLDLNEVISVVLRLVRNELITRSVVLHTQLEPGLPQVMGDGVQLQQVLLNLLVNACDAMADQNSRTLMVRTERSEGQGVKVEVIDCGKGIVVNPIEKIFEPFTTTKAHGLGLGLAISRNIVESHGGRLWAENNPEGGATFTFILSQLDFSH